MAGVRRGDSKPRIHYTQEDKDHFIKDVDPYIKPGDANSGLLPRIFKIENLKNGQGDRKIQAYNYRVCLTTDPARRIPIEKPAGYQEIDHELLLRNFDASDDRFPALVDPAKSRRSTKPTSAVSCGRWRTIRACPRPSARRLRPTGWPRMNSPTTAAGLG
jgi:hypothetical protein